MILDTLNTGIVIVAMVWWHNLGISSCMQSSYQVEIADTRFGYHCT